MREINKIMKINQQSTIGEQTDERMNDKHAQSDEHARASGGAVSVCVFTWMGGSVGGWHVLPKREVPTRSSTRRSVY